MVLQSCNQFLFRKRMADAVSLFRLILLSSYMSPKVVMAALPVAYSKDLPVSKILLLPNFCFLSWLQQYKWNIYINNGLAVMFSLCNWLNNSLVRKLMIMVWYYLKEKHGNTDKLNNRCVNSIVLGVSIHNSLLLDNRTQYGCMIIGIKT